jgi:hypothetical protein
MSEQTTVAPAAPRLGLGVGIGMVVAIFGFSSLWIGLAGGLLHLHSFFASFVFAWYWGSVERLAFSRLVPSLLGSLAGVLLSWLLVYLSAHYGTPGLTVAVVLIALAVLCLVMQWFASVINMSAMLFLALLSAAQFAGRTNYLDMAGTIIAGGLFMALIVYIVQRVMALLAQRKNKAGIKLA